MKKFILRLMLFCLPLAIIGSFWFSFKHYRADYDQLIGVEVYRSLIKLKKIPKHVKTLLFGDSIARQAYSNEEYNGEVFSLATNQAVSMAGQYILLHESLKSVDHPEMLDVVLVYRPSSFHNDLDQPYTFNYFLKPFYRQQFMLHLTDYALDRIDDIPYNWLVRIPFVRKSRWSPAYRVNQIDEHPFKLSALSIEYLHKMKSLSERYGLKSFKVLCPFISDEFSMDDFRDFQRQVEENQLDSLFTDYFQKVVFIDRGLFLDGRHLRDPTVLGHNYLGL